MPQPDAQSVDTLVGPSVSFGAPDLPARHSLTSRAPIPVGPGRVALVAPGLDPRDEDEGMFGLRVQSAKVQRPPIRDDTLARHRLLDWLAAKIHHRVVLVIAEAGYGKTTLLADFSHRTRLRTLWYRLDETDASWPSFLAHLVAAGREVDPAFAPATSSLLAEVGLAGPPREAVTETLVRELDSLAESGAVVVLDDYHAVDESDDVRYIMRRLLAAAPERVTFVLSTRRAPGLPLARARAQGEVAELTAEDLRFDEAETEQLFRETYGHPLEPDVLAELSRRTEGWAASLQLVRAAIRDRTTLEVRTLVGSISGARGDIHDYLAEEVVGDLPMDLQAFLMRAALLLDLDAQSCAAVANVPISESRHLLDQAERAGILSRRHARAGGTRGFHPLVREFLEDRLRSEIGSEALAEVRRNLGREAAHRDWRTAVHHLQAAGDFEEARGVVGRSLAVIMGSGQEAMAAEVFDTTRAEEVSPTREVLRSRIALRSGDLARARAHAVQARRIAPADPLALMNLMSTAYTTGDFDEAARLADEVLRHVPDPLLRTMADVLVAGIRSSQDHNLDGWLADLESVARDQGTRGHHHFQGIALLNAANVLRAQGLAEKCVDVSRKALALLSRTSRGTEVASGQLTLAWALAHLGRLAEARTEMTAARETINNANAVEILVESADIELWYGDPASAEHLLAQAAASPTGHGYNELLHASRLHAALSSNRLEEARALGRQMDMGRPSLTPGLFARQLALRAYLSLRTGSPDASRHFEDAVAHSRRQGVGFWQGFLSALDAVTRSPAELNAWVRGAPDAHVVFVSVLAERFAERLPDLEDDAIGVIRDEARRRSERWRPVLRTVLSGGGLSRNLRAARLLDEVGEAADIALLRKLVRGAKGIAPPDRALGRSLARRLAPRVEVRDLGRVSIAVGPSVIPGTHIRRKVLALLCYLVSRPGFSATRDEIVDAMWPDLDPEVALNSLNQTVYFLRRIFEARYQEDLSPGYVHHSSDVLWLDEGLVTSSSRTCHDILAQPESGRDPVEIERLTTLYTDRFALDFAYEEWAGPYRDRLHAAFLRVVETVVHADTVTGNFDRGIRLCRRALSVDPDAEQVELSLLRLYRLSGAHAAAAEQYAHYASVLRRDLGIDPPPLESI